MKEVLENAIVNLPFHRIILNIYVVYIQGKMEYEQLMVKLVKLFEESLVKAKPISKAEFNYTLSFYTKTMRVLSKDIQVIFKIEKK